MKQNQNAIHSGLTVNTASYIQTAIIQQSNTTIQHQLQRISLTQNPATKKTMDDQLTKNIVEFEYWIMKIGYIANWGWDPTGIGITWDWE